MTLFRFKEAMQNEFKHGMCTIEKGETLEGVVRFSKGEGRHGVFGGSEGSRGQGKK